MDLDLMFVHCNVALINMLDKAYAKTSIFSILSYEELTPYAKDKNGSFCSRIHESEQLVDHYRETVNSLRPIGLSEPKTRLAAFQAHENTIHEKYLQDEENPFADSKPAPLNDSSNDSSNV